MFEHSCEGVTVASHIDFEVVGGRRTWLGTRRMSDWWISGDATLIGSGFAAGVRSGGTQTSWTRSWRSGGPGGGGFLLE